MDGCLSNDQQCMYMCVQRDRCGTKLWPCCSVSCCESFVSTVVRRGWLFVCLFVCLLTCQADRLVFETGLRSVSTQVGMNQYETEEGTVLHIYTACRSYLPQLPLACRTQTSPALHARRLAFSSPRRDERPTTMASPNVGPANKTHPVVVTIPAATALRHAVLALWLLLH